MKNTVPVSVGILTYNNEKTIEHCLESVKDCVDIIVCDGSSTDQTVRIAESYGATVLEQDTQFKNPDGSIANFSGVRNQMLAASKYKWFVFIDSDEYLSKEALNEIAEIAKKETFDLKNDFGAYWMPRKNVHEGKVVMCTTTYPNYQMRFFHLDAVVEFIKEVHERIKLKDGVNVGYLKHPEYVPFEFTKESWKKKLNYYLKIEEERSIGKPFSNWFRHTFFNTIKLTVLYGFRLVKLMVFCRGKRMPLWYETMQFWYHWNLAFKTGKKYLGIKS